MSRAILTAVIAKLKAGMSLRRATRELGCKRHYMTLYRLCGSKGLIVRRGASKRKCEALARRSALSSREERLISLFCRDFPTAEYRFWQRRGLPVPESSNFMVME